MAESRYIEVKTSDYVPLNPDTGPGSVPVNGYFEFVITRAWGVGTGRESALEKAEAETDDTRAKKAPTLRISGLCRGGSPMFGSGAEAEAFVNLLVLEGEGWIKRQVAEGDGVEFVYTGQAGTLAENFQLRVWCNGVNSTAEKKGVTVLRVESRDFSTQFQGAVQDDYEINVKQAYVPRILFFGLKGMEPVGFGEYLVEMGQEVLLSWEIRGDCLRSPVLVENNGIPQTVSPDLPEKYVVGSACVFTLRVESNSLPGVWNSRRLVLGISTGPEIAYFQADREFCLEGEGVRLCFGTSAAGNRIITAPDSRESPIEVPDAADCVMVYPMVRDEKKRTVTYLLTASGYKGGAPASAGAMTSVTVSRWKKLQGTGQLPVFGEYDRRTDVFSFLDNYYCYAGGCLWESPDGGGWKKLSGPCFPKEMEGCRVSAALCEGEVYVFCGACGGSLIYSRYSLGGKEKGKWSQCRSSGISQACAGAALCFPDGDRKYVFTCEEDVVRVWDYQDSPFESWGQVGSLQASGRVRELSAVYAWGRLNLAVACDDGYTYVYETDQDLQGGMGPPEKIPGDTAWVKLVQAEGGVFALTQKGVYDLRGRCWRDMLFDADPRMVGAAGGNLMGISAQGQLWSM